jgi:Type II/IV secretion system protein
MTSQFPGGPVPSGAGKAPQVPGGQVPGGPGTAPWVLGGPVPGGRGTTAQGRPPGQGGGGRPPRSRTATGTMGTGTLDVAGIPAAAGATTAAAGPGPAGTMPAGLVQRVLSRLLADGSIASDPLSLRATVAGALAEDGIVLPAPSLAAVVASIGDELTGLGPLAPLLADPAVTDVLVNGPAEVWVERGGVMEPAAVRFPSAAALAALVQRVVAPLGLRVDESRPWVDARLPGGERFHAVLPPLAPDGPVVTIRTFARRRLQLRDLIERDALDEATGRLLEAMVAAGVAIAVSGATGTGKTTLLNVLERQLAAQRTSEALSLRYRPAIVNSRQVPLTPFNGWVPRSSRTVLDPTTRSRTVPEVRISSGPWLPGTRRFPRRMSRMAGAT